MRMTPVFDFQDVDFIAARQVTKKLSDCRGRNYYPFNEDTDA